MNSFFPHMSNGPPVSCPMPAQSSVSVSASLNAVGSDDRKDHPLNVPPNVLIASDHGNEAETATMFAEVSGSAHRSESVHESDESSTSASPALDSELGEVESAFGQLPWRWFSDSSESLYSVHRNNWRAVDRLDMVEYALSDISSALRDIQELLREEREERKRRCIDEKREKLQQTNNELSSAVAVMAVFIAALNAALLSYTNDVYSNRASLSDDEASLAPGKKYSDKVTISCLIMSMFLALAPASFAGLSKHRMTVRALAAFKYWLRGTFNNPSFLGGRGHRNGQTDESGGVEVIVNDMPVWIISFLGPSMLLLTMGMFVFCWTEQPRAVAHAAAVALGYSTIRMIIFFANSVKLSDTTAEDKRGSDEEEPKERPRRGRRARSPSEDTSDVFRFQLCPMMTHVD